MGEGLNRVMLLGNLGTDPELRMAGNGSAVLKMRLATSETYLDRNKQRQERTEWHSIVVFGKRAEALGKFLTKGSRLFIEGGLRTSSYENREGVKVWRTEIVANNVILGGRSEQRSSGDGGYSGQRTEPASDGYGSPADDDDIPF